MHSPFIRSLIVISCLASGAFAEVRLPAVFSDHMVVQQDLPVAIWGWAAAGEKVKIEFAGQAAEATADADGRWKASLPALEATAEPQTMTVAGTNRIEIKDVLIGEVWLGSGQSNMAMTVNRAKDFEKEKAAANHPQMRFFTVANQNSQAPQADCKGEWKTISPDTVGLCSATAFFFGRELHRELKTPTGLIVSAVGGTPIDAWTDREKQMASPELKPLFDSQPPPKTEAEIAQIKQRFDESLANWRQAAKQARKEGKTPPRPPRNPLEVSGRKANIGGLFNGMIAPLIPFTFRGAIWYQGEANSTPEKAPFYQHQLPLLITDWRSRWGREFPFAWVQLPNFTGASRDWPTIREGMAKALRVPNTGMAVTIDIGDPADIHPKNKQEAGRRLALWALNSVYGRKDVTASGPVFSKAAARGTVMRITFDHASGLRSRDGELTGFQIAGDDKQWRPAKANIEGDSVLVSNEAISNPAAVRYAWENNPKCNLINAAGLPAAPFRTDEW